MGLSKVFDWITRLVSIECFYVKANFLLRKILRGNLNEVISLTEAVTSVSANAIVSFRFPRLVQLIFKINPFVLNELFL